MTVQVLKSQIGDVDAFAASVAAHAQELAHYAAHIALVKQGKAQAYPPPDALHPLIDACVRRPDFVPNFIVVDDTPKQPTPDELLRQRKDELLALIQANEAAAVAAVLPPGKQRLLDLDRAELLPMDTHYQFLLEEGKATPADALTAEQIERIAEIRRIDTAVNLLWRRAARLSAEVEDLTAETVEAWVQAHQEPFA